MVQQIGVEPMQQDVAAVDRFGSPAMASKVLKAARMASLVSAAVRAVTITAGIFNITNSERFHACRHFLSASSQE